MEIKCDYRNFGLLPFFSIPGAIKLNEFPLPNQENQQQNSYLPRFRDFSHFQRSPGNNRCLTIGLCQQFRTRACLFAWTNLASHAVDNSTQKENFNIQLTLIFRNNLFASKKYTSNNGLRSHNNHLVDCCSRIGRVLPSP